MVWIGARIGLPLQRAGALGSRARSKREVRHVAVVAGGSKGIGLAVVRTLAAEGALVVTSALTIDRLRELDGVTAVAVGLVEPGDSERLIREALERHGRIDVLVNNLGGVKIRPEGFLSLTDADFERSLQLNFFAALRATRAAVAAMVEQGRRNDRQSGIGEIRSSTPTEW